MAEGYVPAYRKLFDPDHHMAMAQPVCPRFAWLDLCQMGTHTERSVSYGYDVIELDRGELVASVRTLADRWRWSKSRVQRFLSVLENRDSLCSVRGTPAGTVYRIVNTELYWHAWDSERDSSGTPSGTAAGQQRDKNNNEKKENSSRKRATKLPSDWKPNEAHQKIAKDEGRDLDREAVKFRDHAAATGRTMKDWDAAFRNWLRSGYSTPNGRHGSRDGSGSPYVPGLHDA